MMGRTHAVTGAFSWIGMGIFIDLPVDQILAGAVLTSGAALVPDLDHPKSSISNSAGIPTVLLSWVMEKISGGHRNGTHSLIGVGIISALVFATTIFLDMDWLWAFLMVMGFLSVLGIGKGLALGAFGAIITFLGEILYDAGPIVPYCMLVGIVVHILGDMITKGGCPVLFPDKTRYSFNWFKTGDPIESVIQAGLTISLLPMSMVALGIL